MVHGKLGFVIYIVIINFNLLVYESQTISEIRITLKTLQPILEMSNLSVSRTELLNKQMNQNK